MQKVVTFKVHKAKRQGEQVKVLLHQLDPHEHVDIKHVDTLQHIEGVGPQLHREEVRTPIEGRVNELVADLPHSGEAKIVLLVTAPDALEFFAEGALVDVSFSPQKG